MKYLLLFILFPFTGKGQDTTTHITLDTTKSANWIWFRFQPQDTETVKVIMLVCDTGSAIIETGSVSKVQGGKLYQKFVYDTIYNKSVYWQFGYEVREWHDGSEMINDGICMGCPDWFKHLQYLDDKKRPLPKSVIVWMSKSID